MNDLPISFGGIHPSIAGDGVCAMCGVPLEHFEWVIHENETGRRVTLCEAHYKQWEDKRTGALHRISSEFREALKAGGK